MEQKLHSMVNLAFAPADTVDTRIFDQSIKTTQQWMVGTMNGGVGQYQGV